MEISSSECLEGLEWWDWGYIYVSTTEGKSMSSMTKQMPLNFSVFNSADEYLFYLNLIIQMSRNKKYGHDSFFFGSTVQHVGVPQPGIESTPLAVEVRSLNHWTAREAPGHGAF